MRNPSFKPTARRLRLASLFQLFVIALLAACSGPAAPKPLPSFLLVTPTSPAASQSTNVPVASQPTVAATQGAASSSAGGATATGGASGTGDASGVGVPQTGQGQTVKVTLGDDTFTPADLTVPVGTTVVWTNQGQHPHTVTADDNSFTSQVLNNGQTFSHSFTKEGVIQYHCNFHGAAGGQGMAGAITVVAASSATGGQVAAASPTAPAATAAETAASAPASTTVPATTTATSAPATTNAPAATSAATSAPAAGQNPPGTVTFTPFSAVNRDSTQAALSSSITVGTTTAGGPLDLWTAWAENAAGNVRQIFTSEQAGGQGFQTRGASLNIHANVIGDFPSITFAGDNRLVPWVAWEEPSPGFGNVQQIFASRFNTATGLWQPAGKDRSGSEASINLHTNRQANHPFIFSGSGDPTKPPSPWVTWEEQSNVSNVVQIFVAKGVKDSATSGVIGGFHWEMVGKVDNFNEPTINVDRSRAAQRPTGVFAETGSSVPWITWQESGNGRPSRIFTARGVADAKTPGGFNWINVPPCKPDETACTLNVNPLRDAKDATMAAGSLTPGEAPVPWLTWAEIGPTGKWQVVVSRLDLSTRNSFLPVGGSLNVDQNHDSRTPIITFVKNVPYVAWLEDDGTGKFLVRVRHLASDAQTGTWALDTPASGFTANPSLPESGLSAVGSESGLFLSWTEGNPSQGASKVVGGFLKP